MKIAVILFNLGGPSSLNAVRPFLFNLFYDPAIVNLPNPFRFIIARFISILRTSKAQKIYKVMGGFSPITANTQKQAEALEDSLNTRKDYTFKTFIAMRYWHPRTYEILEKVENYQADKIVLLPLYPQFSTTTTDSFLNEWKSIFKGSVKVHTIHSYPIHQDFVRAHADLIKAYLQEINARERPYILFSAHGLPQKVVDRGDPYQSHVEQSVKAVVDVLKKEGYLFDFKICYQSKVGPLKWLEPSTTFCIKEMASQKCSLVVVPISFVSEHSETLVELDVDYKELALSYGASSYTRIPSLGCHKAFIDCLHDLTMNAIMN